MKTWTIITIDESDFPPGLTPGEMGEIAKAMRDNPNLWDVVKKILAAEVDYLCQGGPSVEDTGN